jgi:hypothetical protein
MQQANKKFRIVSAMNGKAITISKGQRKIRPGDLLIENYSNSPYQQFYIENIFENQYYIKSAAEPNKVFDVTNESKEVYKEILVYDNSQQIHQKWLIIDMPNNAVQIVSVYNGLALEIQGGIDAEGLRIVQNINYKNKSQLWKIEPV